MGAALLTLATAALPARAQARADSATTDSTRRPGAPRDTTPKTAADSAALRAAQARHDSIVAFRLGDTIKTPIARFEAPRTFEIVDRFRFDRDAILRSEATNLADLLERVPGMTTFRTGWLASAHLAAYLGDFGRVRVFVDGMEMDAIDPRSNGVLDLTDVYLFTLDEIVIERSASETRVWCRTWTTTHTTAYTRTDIFTGDLNTNGFRALFARRYANGFALQVAAQQFATQQGRSSLFSSTAAGGRGNGSNQTITARTGYTRGKLSLDGYAVVTTRDRDSQLGKDSTVNVPNYRGQRREGYVRLGYGDTLGGLWAQAVVGALRSRLDGVRAATNTDTSVKSDTIRSTTQQLFVVGYSTPRAQLSVLERLRTTGGRAYHAPALRAAYRSGALEAGLFAENSPLDSSQHVDGALRIAPVSWGALAFNHTTRDFTSATGRAEERVTRAEAGVRLRKLWLMGGVIHESPSVQKAPALIVGNKIPSFSAVSSNGVTFGVHGGVYKDLSLDVQGIGWSDARVYRPQFSMRTDLGLESNWLNRFPKGQFSINAHLVHEIRDPITFPYSGPTADSVYTAVSNRAQVFTSLLEIRIQRATLFYHFHNITGQPYELVPGIVMPRQVQFYGVRWEFFN